MAQCDANSLIAQACISGFTCRSEPELLALLNQLLCNYSSGGGSAGATQAFSGSGAPTTQVPANNAGTYYDYTNKVLYSWNPITPGWE